MQAESLDFTYNGSMYKSQIVRNVSFLSVLESALTLLQTNKDKHLVLSFPFLDKTLKKPTVTNQWHGKSVASHSPSLHDTRQKGRGR